METEETIREKKNTAQWLIFFLENSIFFFFSSLEINRCYENKHTNQQQWRELSYTLRERKKNEGILYEWISEEKRRNFSTKKKKKKTTNKKNESKNNTTTLDNKK